MNAFSISTALAFVHLAFAGSTPDTRRQAISSVTAANARAPRVTASLIREGLLAWLSQRANGPAPAAAVKNAEGEEVSSAPKSYGRQMRALLSAVSSFPDETPAEERQDVLLSLLVLAHHPEVDDRDRQCFIDLCHRGQVDPRLLATSRLPEALTAIEDAVAAPETREAAFPALSSLAFVAPDVVIAELVTKVEGDLAAEETARLTQEQLGMWQTPQGSLYVDGEFIRCLVLMRSKLIC